MTSRTACLLLVFLLEACFSMACRLQLHERELIGQAQSGDILQIVLGDAKRMFANHFFIKADVYFHRGYYPDFMQQSYAQGPTEVHIAERHDPGEPAEDESKVDFLGKPKNWIDGFGRNFYPSHHSHRDAPGEAREILPWLALSADLDPHQTETYRVGAYWLISNMGKINEAEQFLRQGLRANPDSYDILYDLGLLYLENRHDPERARNIWELAERRWQEQDEAGNDPDIIAYDSIEAHLAALEEGQGNLPRALDYLESELLVTPVPDAVKQHIADVKQKIAAQKK